MEVFSGRLGLFMCVMECREGWLPPSPSQPLRPAVTTQVADALMEKHPPQKLSVGCMLMGGWVRALNEEGSRGYYTKVSSPWTSP